MVVVVALLGIVEYALVLVFLADQPARTAGWVWVSLAEFTLWLALAPLVVALARRYPIRLVAGSWRILWLHFGCSLVYALLECAIRAVASLLLVPDLVAEQLGGGLSAYFVRQLVSFLMVEAMIYWTIVALTQWWTADHRRTRAESEAAVARMQAVQQSLAPHFTLNALNALVSMLPEASREQRFAIAIGGFMHDLLAARNRVSHALAEECAMIGRYLAIERERLGDRLDVQIDVAPEVLSLEVPVLALQPLMENAVRHAVAPFRAGGRIRFTAWRELDEITLQLDSEASEPLQPMPGFGHGEESARVRFELLHGRHFWFRSARRDDRRYGVTIRVSV